MASRKRCLRIGDLIAIPLDGDRIAIAQVVGSYLKKAYYFSVLAEPCKAKDLKCVESRLDGEIAFLALSFDAKVAAGHWAVIGYRNVDSSRIPFPAYVEGVSPPGSFEVVDYSGQRRRAATLEDTYDLGPRTIVAPVRIEKAIRAFHGLEPWNAVYDDLRLPSESATSNYWFPGS